MTIGMGPRLILLTVLLAQLADAVTFVLAIGRFGIGVESNGIAAGLYRLAGMDGVLLGKLAAIVITLLVLAAVGHRFPRVLFFGGATGTSLGLVGLATNSLALLVLG
jgi:hypothetical protein